MDPTAPQHAKLQWQAAPEIAVAFCGRIPVGHTYRRFCGEWRARRHGSDGCRDFKTMAQAAGYVAGTNNSSQRFEYRNHPAEPPACRRRRLRDIAAAETVQAAASLLVRLSAGQPSPDQLAQADALTADAVEAAETLAVSRWERILLRRRLRDVLGALHGRPRHEWRATTAGDVIVGDVVRVYSDREGLAFVCPAVSQDHSGRFVAADRRPWLVTALNRPSDGACDPIGVRLTLRHSDESAVMEAHPRERVEVSECHSSRQPVVDAARVEALRSLVLA